MKRFRQLVTVCLSFLALASGMGAQGQVPATKAQEPAPEKNPATVFKSVRYDPGTRRDPFLNPLLIAKKREVDPDAEEERGTPPPGIAGMYIAQVVLLGTSFRDGGYTAVFQGTDKRAYFLREGDRLFDGHVKEVRGDRVVMVRTTKMKSGKVKTEEIVKELRIQ